MIHAYDKNYLEKAQALLGRMLDFAVYDFNVDVEKFYKKFCDSEYARRFEIGELPCYPANRELNLLMT